jgi:hypothetical protein
MPLDRLSCVTPPGPGRRTLDPELVLELFNVISGPFADQDQV